ncbi:MAG: WhiB family transcriptional regulator [Propionibacteriaceae bacterium]|nr:MAG: WhiB family transcriptional regulator [Propionibacteriaceae bacterium]
MASRAGHEGRQHRRRPRHGRDRGPLPRRARRRRHRRPWPRRRAGPDVPRPAAALGRRGGELVIGEHVPHQQASWQELAACEGRDPVMFDDHRRREEAKAMCDGCPVRSNCLEAAMQHEGARSARWRAGVWGGLTAQERAELARARDAAPVLSRCELCPRTVWTVRARYCDECGPRLRREHWRKDAKARRDRSRIAS